jgi:hypothetical protein
MASITVYFKPITELGVTLPYYHEFIVYQPDSGDAQYLRGGPAANQGLSLDSGGGSGSSGSTSAEGPNFPFGAVTLETGTFVPSAPDYTNPDGSSYTSDPSQVIATGSDSVLGAQFTDMVSYMTSMYSPGGTYGADGIAYGPTGPNSNSVVTTALQYEGLSVPSGTGLSGEYAAPGADVALAPASFGTVFANDLGVLGNLVGNTISAVGSESPSGRFMHDCIAFAA